MKPKTTILLSLIAAAFVTVLVYLNLNKSPNPINYQPIPTITPSNTPLPTKDYAGKYVNQDLGISFDYPQDIFIYQSNSEPDSQYWSNKKDGGAPLELGLDGLWLNLSFSSNPGAVMLDFYNQIIGLKPQETIAKSAVTKISNLNTNGIKGAVYHQGIPDNFAGEAAYSYEAVWISANNVYRLSLSAFTQDNLQKNQTVFNKIISSVKFDLL